MTALDFGDFATGMVDAGSTRIFTRRGGAGRPLLLLHGFPETHLMWRSVAPILARDHLVVCADLRGYGASECPPSDPDHEAYSKRAMAQDMVEVMASLGHERFAVVGIASLDVPHRRENLMPAAGQPFGRVPPESCACSGDQD